MSTSDELREALNRRLKRIDVSQSGIEASIVQHSIPLEVAHVRSPGSKEDPTNHQTYRSGWATTAPIPRSVVLPPPRSNPGSPAKSESPYKKVCFQCVVD